MITHFKFTHGAKAGRQAAGKGVVFVSQVFLGRRLVISCCCRMWCSRGHGRGAAAALGPRTRRAQKKSKSAGAPHTQTHTYTHAHSHECLVVCVALCNLIMGPAWTATALWGGSDACGGGWQIAKNCTHILLFKSPTTHTHVCVFVFFPAFSAPFATFVVVAGILFALFWLKLCTFSVWLSNTIFFPLSSLPSCFPSFFFFFLFPIAITSCRPIIDDCAMSCHNLRSFLLAVTAPAPTLFLYLPCLCAALACHLGFFFLMKFCVGCVGRANTLNRFKNLNIAAAARRRRINFQYGNCEL